MENTIYMILGLVTGLIILLVFIILAKRKAAKLNKFPDLPNRISEIDFNSATLNSDEIADLVSHVFCVTLHGLLKTELSRREAIMETVDIIREGDSNINISIINNRDVTIYYKDAISKIILES